MAKSKETNVPSEVLYNIFQACNIFQLSGRNRRIAMAQHQGQLKAQGEWQEVLKNEKLLK